MTPPPDTIAHEWPPQPPRAMAVAETPDARAGRGEGGLCGTARGDGGCGSGLCGPAPTMPPSFGSFFALPVCPQPRPHSGSWGNSPYHCCTSLLSMLAPLDSSVSRFFWVSDESIGGVEPPLAPPLDLFLMLPARPSNRSRVFPMLSVVGRRLSGVLATCMLTLSMAGWRLAAEYRIVCM